jgi:hypothetical protein
MSPPTLFSVLIPRYMKTYRLSHERGVLHRGEFIPLSTKKVGPLRKNASFHVIAGIWRKATAGAVAHPGSCFL